jgi:hypothetical protein
MSRWRRLVCVSLTVALAIGTALHLARAGTMTLAMAFSAEAPSMPGCDGCGDASARPACDPACVPGIAALPPADAATFAMLSLAPAVVVPPRLAGLADPPDPDPPRPVARS